MRVLVISHALTEGSVRGRWQRLAERPGWEVALLVPARWTAGTFGAPLCWQPAAEARPCWTVWPRPVWRAGDWQRYLFRNLGSAVRRFQPDVIAVMQEENTWVLQQALALRRHWWPRARLVFFTWNNLAVSLRRPWQQWQWHRVCAHTDAALAGSTEAAQCLRRAGYARPVHVQTEIGVDTEQFQPDPAARSATRNDLGLVGFTVGYAGRLVPEKGLSDLCAAWTGPGLRAAGSLLVVGDGPLRLELEQRVRGPTVRFTGRIPVEDMRRFLCAMDVLVLPSRTTAHWKEQFGLVLAQAMACGVPVVGSDSGAIPEVIGDAGLVFPEGDAASLGTQLAMLASDPGRRQQLGSRGRARVLAHYSAEALAVDFAQWAEHLMEQPCVA